MPPRGRSADPTPERRHCHVSEQIIHVTDESFEEDVLKSPQPVLVDYWANWCAPCKMIAPVLEEIAQEYAGRVRVAKLDIDENRAVTERFNVRGIPTLILFKNGEAEAIKVGAVTKSQLTAFVDSNL
jgi:thioredoxin 1